MNQDLFEHYKKLTGLRKQNPALSSNNIDFFHENPEAKVLAYTRWQEQGSRVVVVVNFSDSVLPQYHIPNFPEAGIWHDSIRGDAVEAGEREMSIDLAEYEARILVLETDLPQN